MFFELYIGFRCAAGFMTFLCLKDNGWNYGHTWKYVNWYQNEKLVKYKGPKLTFSQLILLNLTLPFL